MSQAIELLTSREVQAKLSRCIHCGLCLQACPTYAVFGTEMDGPRGRIALMRAAAEGYLRLDSRDGSASHAFSFFEEHIIRCLACRACETACPSGVQYGSLVEVARIAIEPYRRPGPAERFGRWLGLRQLMPYASRLRFLARLAWLYQASGLQRLVRSLDILPKRLKAMEAILPPIVPKYGDTRTPAPALGVQQGRVAFFTGCIQDAFLAPVNAATVRVLQRNGYEVHFPRQQTCCAAAQLHTGEVELARELARRNINAFLAEDFDAVISNAGGCGLALKEYPHLLQDDPRYAERALQFAGKVKDISEFLADHLHVPPQGQVQARATYVDSCHLRHGQKVSAQPRALLRSISGLQLVELQQPDRCCGSAGVYNITQADTASVILDAKMANIAATGAELVVTSNTGCHLQLIAGARRAGLKAKVMHVVEVLDMAYTSTAADTKDAKIRGINI